MHGLGPVLIIYYWLVPIIEETLGVMVQTSGQSAYMNSFQQIISYLMFIYSIRCNKGKNNFENIINIVVIYHLFYN